MCDCGESNANNSRRSGSKRSTSVYDGPARFCVEQSKKVKEGGRTKNFGIGLWQSHRMMLQSPTYTLRSPHFRSSLRHFFRLAKIGFSISREKTVKKTVDVKQHGI
jgi:hypothetical protein